MRARSRAQRRLMIIIPLTLLLIFFILYTMFSSMKWSLLIFANVAVAPIGGIVALYLTGVNFSVSSGVGFLALFGVSVQTGVIMVEYINQLRARGHTMIEAAEQGAILRLRPIMMTMLVATLGLLPAATSHGIGSDSQRPFAIVIVGGLMGALLMSIYLLPDALRLDRRRPRQTPHGGDRFRRDGLALYQLFRQRSLTAAALGSSACSRMAVQCRCGTADMH